MSKYYNITISFGYNLLQNDLETNLKNRVRIGSPNFRVCPAQVRHCMGTTDSTSLSIVSGHAVQGKFGPREDGPYRVLNPKIES